MADKISRIIAQRHGNESLVDTLCELSGSELSSLLLEVFARKTEQLKPADLLKHYSTNRFVQPPETNYVFLLERTLATLNVLAGHGFIPQQVSPLSQLGTCSVVASVDQHKIVSAIRNCEVMSDVTNSLALYISHQKKRKAIASVAGEHIKFASVQQHVRAQPTAIKGFSPHFTIGCLVSSGIDGGSYKFEMKALQEHFIALQDVLHRVFARQPVYFRLLQRKGYTAGEELVARVYEHLVQKHALDIRVASDASDNNYYTGIQFKAVISVNGQEIEIADGGLVDWTQQLLNNRKERFCISGFGLELLNKFDEGLIP
jgi:hypothetical protein